MATIYDRYDYFSNELSYALFGHGTLSCPSDIYHFIGAMVVFVSIHPPVALLLRVAARQGKAHFGPFGGVATLLIVLAGVCSVAMGAFGSSNGTIAATAAVYGSFLAGALLIMLARSVAVLLPSLCLQLPRAPTYADPRPLVRPLAGLCADAFFLSIAVPALFFPVKGDPASPKFQGDPASPKFLLVAAYLLLSCCTAGAGLSAWLLRTTPLTFVGSVALEVYVLSPGWHELFLDSDLAKCTVHQSQAPPCVTGGVEAILFMSSLVLVAHGLAHHVVQPLLSSFDP